MLFSKIITIRIGNFVLLYVCAQPKENIQFYCRLTIKYYLVFIVHVIIYLSFLDFLNLTRY